MATKDRAAQSPTCLVGIGDLLEGLTAFDISSLFNGDLPWLARVASLLVLPFAHEDLAILLGGYLVVNDVMPAAIVAAAIYVGIVASDFALYGLGAAARSVPWLSRFAREGRGHRFGDILKRNVFAMVAFCRVVPGVVFFAFVACGWARVSLWRFSLASLSISALYLPLMLYLVIVFGDALDERMGLWAWPMLLVAFTATSFARKRIFAFADAAKAGPADAVVAGHKGMPALVRGDRKVALAERIPPLLFYLPLVLNWIRLGLRHRCLTLPTVANPTIPTGGMWGESKSDYLVDVDPAERKWIADFVVLKRNPGPLAEDVARARQALHGAALAFPLVAKPDIG